MQQAGWYEDPAGVPGRFRFWDGQQWREEVTFDPTAPIPSATGAPAAPSGLSGPAKIGIGIGAAAVLALVVTLALLLPSLLTPAAVPGEPTPQPGNTTPGGGGTPGSTTPPTGSPGSGELNCAGGNQVAIGSPQDSYESTGIRVETPADWSFRLDKSQWTWLDDQSAYGALLGPDKELFEGMALGGVAARNGFSDPENASGDIVTCLNRYGVYNEREYPQQEISSEAVTIAGMSGWKRVVEFEDDQETKSKTRVAIYVLQSGQPSKLATLTTIHPVGDSASEARIAGVVDSITKL